MNAPEQTILKSTPNFSACFFGRDERLFSLRKKRIITTTEYMIFKNFYFGNFEKFLQEIRMTKKRARQFWVSGMNKILKYKQFEIAQNL